MHESNERRPFLTFFVLFLVPLSGVGIDIYTPSLPAITHYFAIAPASVKITLAVYLLGYGVGQPFFGTASDTLGRKKPLIFGLILYLISSLFCAFSPNIWSLIIFRLLQGIAVAAPGSITKSILSDCYTGKALTIKVSLIIIAWGLGPIFAPAIGGYLQYYFGWQSNFYFLAFYGLLGLLLTVFFFRETHRFPIPWHFKETLKAYQEIFTHRLFIGAVVSLAALYSLIILFNTVAPFIIQIVLKQSAIAYGHIAFVMGFAFLLGGFANRFLLQKKESHQIMPVGLAISLISCIAMLFLSFLFSENTLALTIPTFFLIFGGGILFPNFMAKTLGLFPGRGGTASALMGSLFTIGTSIMAAVGSFLQTESLVPLAIFYFLLTLLVLWIYFILFKKPAQGS